jgi:hypothetical protein
MVGHVHRRCNMKLLVSLACGLLFSTPLWAASLTPLDEATPTPSGLYALSHLAARGAVTELTDQELARIEGKTCDFLVGCGLGRSVGGVVPTFIKSGEATRNTLLNTLFDLGITPIDRDIDIDILIGTRR